VSLSVVIAGGGTGGHLYPGIAVARELLARQPDARVTFVGTAAGIEARVIPREGLSLDLIRSAGLKGKSVSAFARGLALLPLSAIDAWRVISRHRPSVVVGVGGYSSGPVVALAALRGIPTLVMEQNAAPGLTNRLLARVVTAAAVTYEESLAAFGEKAFLSGNPVRRAFFDRAPSKTPVEAAVTRLLVFGGSLGAHAINVAMVEAAPHLGALGARLAVTHQAGERDVDMVRAGYARAGVTARVEPFLFEMDREMTSADIVVCRSGATTLAELTAAGTPSILVPLPTATDDHQRKNAAALVAKGAALMLDQRELTGERLAREIATLARDGAARREMALAAGRVATPDAARVIVDRIVELGRAS
jgi:UDP-N-acetylglucosamine--N-acetylmuramyl-(pentapeptide) pyrophosphoryl-undecaprenol N-acetylglucosamine transferase